MDAASIQARLNDRYESFRRTAQMPDRASAPLLVHVFDEWVHSKNRVLVLGQETAGWGADNYYHGHPGKACQDCPFVNFTTFAEWTGMTDGVEACLHVYKVFDFAKTQPPNYRSPFWQAFREILRGAEGKDPKRAGMWSNLFRVDWSGGSVLGAEQTVRQMVMSAQRSLLCDEIVILQPTGVVFLTGPNYDFELKAEFDKVKFHPFDGIPERELARLTHPRLPYKSFRTYHPKFLSLSKRWHFVEMIARQIAQ